MNGDDALAKTAPDIMRITQQDMLNIAENLLRLSGSFFYEAWKAAYRYM